MSSRIELSNSALSGPAKAGKTNLYVDPVDGHYKQVDEFGVVIDLTEISAATQSEIDGKVDDAQVLTNVPDGAIFTDTVYDDTSIQAAVSLNTAKVSADGSVTSHSDVVSAGSGQIITSAERSKLLALATVASTGDYADLVNKPDLSVFDNISEHPDLASFPVTGSVDVFYLAQDTGILYRWTGSAYAVISSQLAIGETAQTAYRGDRGKIAYDHSQLSGNPHSTSALDITDFNTYVALNSSVTANTAKVSADGSIGAHNDVDLTGLADGKILTYVGTSSRFEATSPTSGVTKHSLLELDDGTNPHGTITEGDIKSGLQATDHNGWILLNGRAKSSLSPTQQDAATNLGIGTNIPDGDDAFLTQNGATLGSVSGSNTKTINRNNLPKTTITVSSDSHMHNSFSYTSSGTSLRSNGESARYPAYQSNSATVDRRYLISGTSSSPIRGLTSSDSHNHNFNLNGNVTQQAFDISPKSISINYFLYLGE